MEVFQGPISIDFTKDWYALLNLPSRKLEGGGGQRRQERYEKMVGIIFHHAAMDHTTVHSYLCLCRQTLDKYPSADGRYPDNVNLGC